MVVNDAHCHFFSRPFFEALARQAELSSDDAVATVTSFLQWEAPGPPSALADRWLEELERHHVTRAALIASVPGDEMSVATAVAHHPTRFVGFFMVDPTAADIETRLEAALSQPTLRCACLFPAMHRYHLWDERVLRVVDALASQPGHALFVHCGVLTVGVRRKLGLSSQFEIRFGNPLDLQRIALRYPELPIIVPHFGAGLLREALMMGDLCPNIYLDTSSTNSWLKYEPGRTLADVFRQTLAILGPDRLLFGTDSSYFPRGWQRAIFEQQCTALKQVSDDASVRDRIFGGNFDRLFPLPA